MTSSTSESDSDDNRDSPRHQIFIPTDVYNDEIDTFVDEHFDGNLSRACRACMLAEKKRREEDVDTVELRVMRNKMESIAQITQEIDNRLEATSEDTKELKKGFDGDDKLAQATLAAEERPDSLAIKRKVGDVLREADHSLSINGLVSKTDLGLPALHQALETLLEGGVVTAVEENDTLKYHIANARAEK